MPFALICSPEAAVAESLRVLLGSDWTVFAETTADVLLHVGDDVPADVIFVDEHVRDPELADAVRALRNAAPDVTIVALALSSRSPRISAALPAGLDEVLTKPFDRDAVTLVLHRVQERLRRREARHHGAPLFAAAPAATAPQTEALTRALRILFRSSGALVNPRETAEHLLEGLGELLGLNRGTILWDNDAGAYSALAAHGVRRDRLEAVVFRRRDGLMAWLRTHNQVCRSQGPGSEAVPTLARQEMRLLQADVAVPLTVDGHLRGVLALGNKLTGGAFTAGELELIVSVAQYASATLGHAITQEAVRRQQAQFEGVVRSLASGVVMIDLEGRVQVMNDVAGQVLDMAPASMLGQPAERLGSLIGDILRRTLAGDVEYRRHRVLNPATGQPLGINTSQLRAYGGEVLGAIMVCTSLAGVDQQAPELAEQDELATWNRFALGMAHAIKNPLVAIKTFAQLFPERHGDPEFTEHFYTVALREVERLDGLVKALMQYGSQDELQSEPCDLRDLLADAVALQNPEADSDSPVHVDAGSEAVPTLGDREQLGEAIAQMLLNAREAAGVSGQVWARAVRSPDAKFRAVVEIEDSGPGFPAGTEAQVFSPFFTTKEKGLGLGLALAERVARRHGGVVSIGQSDRGGAKVSLELPLVEADGT